MSQATESAESIIEGLNAIHPEAFKSEHERQKALVAAYALVSRLETPWETTERICMNQPALGACLKIAKDLQLFPKWHETGLFAQNSNSLAELVGCQPELLVRILRHLATNNIIEHIAENTFKLTPFSIALLQPHVAEWLTYMYDSVLPSFLSTPAFLRATNYRNPSDAYNCPFQAGKNGFQGDMFQHFAENPIEGAAFDAIMEGLVTARQGSWLDLVPVREHILAGAEAGPEASPLIVDVGGGIGHDLEKFRAAFPETAGRLYLQDLPGVISRSICPEPVHKVPHDFFTPQPIKGARVYYLHSILHDWPDEKAAEILRMIVPAMKRGYSKLLVHDHVFSEGELSVHETTFDLNMMAVLAGKERTEGEWRALLNSVGLQVVRVWRMEGVYHGVLEAEVV
ncbi:S-adenosyl-L-methionine-dependent methyltransferase [Aspergillus karnatakaensis]|uniref:S-adenosyl-L-methionine-dependent methyltransferase n=1 Tax=Aspergillus karnatakaensis TaxID=1810916 RepID=UPI003CCDD37D